MTKNQDRLVVWGVGTVRTLRAHWILAEFSLPYETRPVGARTGETQTPAYRALNPKGKVPTLQHGPVTVSESAAILTYICARFPPPPGFLVPGDPAATARQAEWCYFTMTELDAHSLYLVRRHEHLADLYGAEPGAVKSAWQYFDKQLRAVQPGITEAGNYLMGDRFSMADILFASCMTWADAYGYALPPVVGDYCARVTGRAGYQAAQEANTATAE